MRMLRYPQLATEKGIPFTPQYLRRLEAQGKFPRRVKLSDATVAWIETEIDAYLATKAAARAASTPEPSDARAA